MTTKLEGPLKREIQIGDETYTLTITPEGFVIVLKGRRKGHELTWASIVNGEAALATALNASLAATAPARRNAAEARPEPRQAVEAAPAPRVAQAAAASKRTKKR